MLFIYVLYYSTVLPHGADTILDYVMQVTFCTETITEREMGYILILFLLPHGIYSYYKYVGLISVLPHCLFALTKPYIYHFLIYQYCVDQINICFAQHPIYLKKF